MNRLPHLDDRLARAAALFPACVYGADIGADHGRLSCVLLAKGICQRMCVADISPASLRKAERLLQVHGLSDRADVTSGDGLTVLPKPAQAIAILGMGGRTVSEILQAGREKLQNAALILSAHTDILLVRRTLFQLDYWIETEEIAQVSGRMYVVLRALPGRENYTEKQLLLGPRLMETLQEHYPAYISWRIETARCKRSPEADEELAWLKEEEERVRDRAND